jgi:5-methylcytosine-specific restriction protein A
VSAEDAPLCPLCLRPIPPEARQSVHHLTPKLKGGKHGPRVLLHQICHNEIHATLTEVEIARAYADPAALRAHPRLARFVAWIADKPPAFHARSLKSLRRRRGR